MLQGVQVLNVNELANALKPVVLPGEIMMVGIVKEGKEPNQGVAYLDDGTMIVVEDGRKFIGGTQPVIVSSVLQTSAGKMIFARVRTDEDGDGYDYNAGRDPRTKTPTAAATIRPTVAVVLPAAGQARRFGSAENKVWATLSGRSVLEWTLAAFQSHPGVDSIVIAAGESDLARVEAAAAQFSKVTKIVTGGSTRAESVLNGLNAVPASADLVLVHDAARPLISAAFIDRVIEATARVGAAFPACRSPIR